MLLFSLQRFLVVDDAELLWGVQSVSGALIVSLASETSVAKVLRLASGLWPEAERYFEEAV